MHSQNNNKKKNREKVDVWRSVGPIGGEGEAPVIHTRGEVRSVGPANGEVPLKQVLLQRTRHKQLTTHKGERERVRRACGSERERERGSPWVLLEFGEFSLDALHSRVGRVPLAHVSSERVSHVCRREGLQFVLLSDRFFYFFTFTFRALFIRRSWRG